MLADEIRLRELLVLGLSGDGPAYHLFLWELSTYLRAYFRRRLGGLPDEVEDLVPETLREFITSAIPMTSHSR